MPHGYLSFALSQVERRANGIYNGICHGQGLLFSGDVRTLHQQTILITGASSGIGEATVRRLVRAGANVALTGRREERLNALCAEIDPQGKHTLALAGDVTSEADRKRWVDATLQRFGRIDALVNNAGYGQRGPIEQVALEAIRRNFETNVFALLGMAQLVAPILRAQGEGRIVNIGSVAGRVARPMSSGYDATKHAVEAFTDGLRGELKPFGIDVVLVRPGFILTEFMGTADRVSTDAISNPGPYAAYVESFKGGARKLHRIAGRPDDIARVVERALSAKHPKTHYAAPKHAKVILFLKWALPVRVLDWLVRLRA
jgi:NAD(P)-dependent dehydrogenase (short-subunit alcohol dehydrogenase family)